MDVTGTAFRSIGAFAFSPSYWRTKIITPPTWANGTLAKRALADEVLTNGFLLTTTATTQISSFQTASPLTNKTEHSRSWPSVISRSNYRDQNFSKSTPVSSSKNIIAILSFSLLVLWNRIHLTTVP